MCKSARTAFCSLIFVALTGCGGGGGGSSSSTPDLIQITSGNAQTIAGAVLSSSLEGGSISSFASTGLTGGGVTKSSAKQVYAKVGSVTDAQVNSLMSQSTAGYMQATVAPQTSDCAVAGTVTVSGDFKSQTTLSVGDTITLSFANCDDGTAMVNGKFAMKISTLSGDLLSGMFSFGLDVTLTDFQVTQNGETATANGDISMLMDATQSPTLTVSVSSDSLTVAGAGSSETLLDYLMTEVADNVSGQYSLQTSGTLTSSAFSGSVMFETQVQLTGTGSEHAVSGEMLITGANGGTIHIIVLDNTNVRLEVDVDGDGQIDTIIDATWTELT